MPYRTYYELEVHGADHDQVAAKLAELVGFDPLDEDNERAWRNQHECMLELAELFPEAVFMVSGEGEDRDDTWRDFYKHGHAPVEQRSEIVFRQAPPPWFAAAVLAADQRALGASEVTAPEPTAETRLAAVRAYVVEGLNTSQRSKPVELTLRHIFGLIEG